MSAEKSFDFITTDRMIDRFRLQPARCDLFLSFALILIAAYVSSKDTRILDIYRLNLTRHLEAPRNLDHTDECLTLQKKQY